MVFFAYSSLDEGTAARRVLDRLIPGLSWSGSPPDAAR